MTSGFDAGVRALYDRDLDTRRRDSLAVLVSLVPPATEVLDVGTGAGALGRHLVATSGCRVDGVTASETEAARAAMHYRKLAVADLNLERLDDLFPGRKYDVIVCADVIEHLQRPTALLESCHRLLKDGGKLLLSVPNVAYSGLIAELLLGDFRYRDEGLLDRTHVRFFTRQSLMRLLRESRWSADRLQVVSLDLCDSEFQPALDVLPPAVRRYLLARPDGMAYQFIVSARPWAGGDASEPEGGVNEPAVTASYSLQLYLKTAAGYAEDRKVVTVARIGERRQRVSFKLPANTDGLTGLRLDPADRPGFLHVFAMHLVNAAGGVIWEWNGSSANLCNGETHDLLMHAPFSAEGGVVLLSTGDDPYFELPLDAGHLAGHVGPLRLELELSWPMAPEYLLFVDELYRRSEREQCLEHELKASLAREQRLKEAAHAAAVEAHDQAMATLAAERRRLLQVEDALTGDLRRAQQEIASLRHALADTRARLDEITEEREALRRHASALENSRWSRLGVRLAQLLGRMRSPLLPQRASRLRPVAPEAWHEARAGVSIVIPVYRGLQLTQACLEAVLSSAARAKLRIVVVNDASPEPELTAYLREVAARDARVELIENENNVGFVASVNLGMQRHGDDDVILLNSDAEVAGDWIDRLRAAAYRDRRIGTVTPFSNAATICSYPRFCIEGPMPDDLSAAALDRYFAVENRGGLVELPTAIGFCMFIRRDCLDEVGLFDAAKFGRGYGEENDFCMRARAAGWRHVLALDTFVRHVGGASFGAEKEDRVRQAEATLAALHPDYAAVIARHIEQDPAHAARRRVDMARIRASGRRSLLFVSHTGGGGTERHVRELAQAISDQANVFLLRPTAAGQTILEWLRPREGFELAFELPADYDALVSALRALGIVHVHFHHLRGHSPRILELPQSLGVKYDFTAHDYHSVCPQITLTDEIGRYCGEFGVEQCQACLQRRPAPRGESISQWRAQSDALLAGARLVFAPSADAAARMRRYFPTASVLHVPHEAGSDDCAPQAPRPLGGQRRLRIAVLGALSQIKGADVLEATAMLASQRHSRLEFHLIGYAYRDLRVVPDSFLRVYGEYAEAALPAMLEAVRPDVVWFPALWPESYSYTLSAALAARLPVVAPDLGAFPDRLAGRPWTWICPWYWLSEEWVGFFERLVALHFDEGNEPSPVPGRPVEASAFSYAHNYLRGLPAPRAASTLPDDFLDRHRVRRGGRTAIA